MRVIVTAALVVLIAAMSFPALALSKAHYVTKAQDIDVSANTISVTQSGSIIIAGNVNVKSVDKATKAVMEAKGSKIQLKFAPTKSKDVQFDSLESAEITGPATMIYTTTQPAGTTKTTATAEKALYSGSDMMAYLTGGVKVVQEDPAYTTPTVITGENASVNLNPTPGPDDVAVKMQTPSGLSKIEAAPTASGSILITASTILGKRNGEITLQDNAYLKSVDSATQAVMEASGSKVVLQLATTKPDAAENKLNTLQSAEIFGPVTVTNTSIQPTGTNKTTATADRATYLGTDQTAHLTGGVKIVQEDPMLAQPAVITGETAIVNLNPNAGPDEITVQVDTPGGVSRIEITPKPKEKKATN